MSVDRLDGAADLATILQQKAARAPDRLILRFLGERDDSEQTLRYGELDRRARAVAAQLLDAGASGRRALILHAPGIEYVAALYGCFYAGVVAVPAYPPRFNRPLPRLRSLIADCQAEFALTSRSLLERSRAQREADPQLARLTWLASDDARDADPLLPKLSPETLALLQYTSGSTSEPKGVMLTHAHFLHNIAALAERGRASAEDRWVSWLPPYHDMGLIGGILLPICSATEVTLLAPSTFVMRPRRWLEALSRFGGTVSGGPNFAYELVVRRVDPSSVAELDLSRWRVAFCGAERVRADTLRRFATHLAGAGFRERALVPCYGLAEATLAVSFGAISAPLSVASLSDRALGEGKVEPLLGDERARELVASGAALDDVAIVIVDPERATPCAEREVGEIWVRSPSVALGYWNAPELSEQTFRARIESSLPEHAGSYLRTGDLGFVLGGELFVSGRAKELLIFGGRNHYPEDIEATAHDAHCALRDRTCVAFSIERDGEERLVIVHEIDPSRQADAPELAQALRREVAREHELSIADVLAVRPGSVPRTSSGKLQRARCRESYLAGELTRLGPSEQQCGPVQAAPPELVARVRSIMAELLTLAEVGPNDDFFMLGGHSLLATQLVSRVREQLSVELTLAQLFDDKTPARLAARISALPKCESRETALIPADRAAPLPLSFSQERMWFLHRLEPSSSAYNVAGAVQIDGLLAADALARAFRTLVMRHEILRSNYDAREGAPRLIVSDALAIDVPYRDLSAHGDPQADALAAASELARAPFDVAREPLARAALFKVAAQCHVLVASLHHLVADAWSMGILLRELFESYEAEVQGRALPTTSAAPSYVDYAAWQRRQFGGAASARELAYWRERLRGAEPLRLPTTYPRTARRSSRGAVQLVELPSELRTQVLELARYEGATPFMVLLAAFEVVLLRHSGQRDLVVGVPVANRNQLSSECLVGTLVNTLAVRTEVAPELTFRELLGHVRERALEAFDHQDLPFERLVSELGVERRAGESPLVQVMFDYQNVPMALSTGTLRLKPCTISRGATQFDLSLLFHDTELGYTGALEYSSDLFDGAAMRRFAEHFVNVLGAVVTDPALRLSEINLVSRAERAFVLEAAGQLTGSTRGFSLLDAFARQVAERPREVAVYDARGDLTYAELDRRVTRLSLQLSAQGAGPGELVGIYLPRSKDVLVALLAVLRCRAAYVPLDPRHPPARIAHIVEDAAPRIIVTCRECRESLPEAAQRSELLDIELASRELSHSDLTFPRALSDALAYVIYTSGSTGRPKGVAVSVGALDNFLAAMAREPGSSAADRMLATTTITFDIAALELLLPLACGASLYVADSDVTSDGQRLNALFQSFAPTIMQATPASYRMLIESGFRGAPGLTLLSGGEALSRELAQQLLDRAGAVWNMYGPTETTVWSLVQRVRRDEDPVPIGRPIAETRVYIVDERRELCPIGVAGEICIGGAGVAQGYLGRPELTAERFVDDPFSAAPARMYRSGDLGRLRGDGSFEHLGRLDHQVKIRGFRIEPGEIESVLLEDARVREALVVAREERRDDVRLVAYYVAGPSASSASSSSLPTALELRERIAQRLPEYMVPSAFVPLERLPQTPNGKVDRSALPAPESDHAPVLAERIAPRDQLEQTLTTLWQEVLGRRPEGVRDNFFALGGHSLLAVRMFAAIQRELHVDLPLATLFEAPTIELLAQRIRAVVAPAAATARTGAAFRHLVPIVDRGSKPALFCVHGAGGHVLGLSPLAQHLATDRPFYALQARGVDGVSEPFATIEQAAHVYVGEIRQVQPSGPYYLAGYCGGGAIAFEMARMLRAAGEPVGLLALIDTYRPDIELVTDRAAQFARNYREHGARFLARRVLKRIAATVLSWYVTLSIALHRALARPLPHALRDPWLTHAFLRAAARYRPARYDGKLVIARARDVGRDARLGPELGWSEYASEGVEVYDVPGDHHSLIDEPNARVLAETLQSCLERAERALQLERLAPTSEQTCALPLRTRSQRVSVGP